MSAPQLAMVGLVVEDMARSLAFYRHLAIDLPADADTQPHVEAALPDRLRLAWDTLENIRSFDPEHPAPSGGSGIALAFLVADPAGVDATYDRLVAAGYDGHKPPWDAFWGQRYALLRDPDGHAVDLFAPLPGAQQ
ncbi:MAG TPA: VOC family protein [Acidimicrobiales bacterium]|nr:VOC family protein [Acidimicrobiales bacterium]